MWRPEAPMLSSTEEHAQEQIQLGIWEACFVRDTFTCKDEGIWNLNSHHLYPEATECSV